MTYNAEIEKSVLGCLILDNELIANASKELTTEYFYNGKNARLFDEILECYNAKGIADITVLKSMDIEELTSICNFVPAVQGFGHYKKELESLKAKRDMLKSLDKFKAKVLEQNCEVDELKIDCLNAISNINTHKKIEENSKLYDVLLDYIDVLQERKTGNVTYRSWGIKWLDDKVGGLKPALTYLAARPSIGKTAFALQIAKTVAKQGSKVMFFSLEMDKMSICNRLVANAGNINKSKLESTTDLTDDEWQHASKTILDIQNLPLIIHDKYYSVEEILLEAEEHRVKNGLDLIVIDYLQLMETKERFGSTNDRVSYISRQLKKYQQKNGIHIIALSQFNRETEMKKYPTLANLRDSGSLEQDANNVFFLHEEYIDPSETRQAEFKEILLIIAKQREGERNICCKMKFYGGTQRFYQG